MRKLLIVFLLRIVGDVLIGLVGDVVLHEARATLAAPAPAPAPAVHCWLLTVPEQPQVKIEQ